MSDVTKFLHKLNPFYRAARQARDEALREVKVIVQQAFDDILSELRREAVSAARQEMATVVKDLKQTIGEEIDKRFGFDPVP